METGSGTGPLRGRKGSKGMNKLDCIRGKGTSTVASLQPSGVTSPNTYHPSPYTENLTHITEHLAPNILRLTLNT